MVSLGACDACGTAQLTSPCRAPHIHSRLRPKGRLRSQLEFARQEYKATVGVAYHQCTFGFTLELEVSAVSIQDRSSEFVDLEL